MIEIAPGNHDCDTPDINADASRELDTNKGHLKWPCPECGSRWWGKARFGYQHTDYQYYVGWERDTPSSRRWKRDERLRLQRLIAAES